MNSHRLLHPDDVRYQYDIYSQSWQLARRLLQSSLGSASASKTSASKASTSKASSSKASASKASIPPGSDDDYTEIICNQEGGYAATVLGLMSSDRIQVTYDNIPPSQMNEKETKS